MKNLMKLGVTAGIIGGLMNIIPVFFGNHWYINLALLFNGLIPVLVAGVISLQGELKPLAVLTQAWINFIFGISIIVLVLSSFYRPETGAVLNWLSGALLFVSSLVILFKLSKEYHVKLIP